MARKSGRVRASKVVYTVDPFAAAGISDDEIGGSRPNRDRGLKRESVSDEEFVGGDEDGDDFFLGHMKPRGRNHDSCAI